MKIKQYCRYCGYCVYGDVVWCDKLDKEMSEASAKRANTCKHFTFCEGDVFNPLHKYKPMQKREKIDNGQLELFDNSADK